MHRFKYTLTLACSLAAVNALAQYPFGQSYQDETEQYKQANISGYEKYRVWESDEGKDSALVEQVEIDQNGRITRIVDMADDDQYVYEYFYNNKGQVTRYSWNYADGDEESGIWTDLLYDKNRLIRAFSLSMVYADTISKSFFSYDSRGLLLRRVDISKNYDSELWTDSIVSTFTYDGSRLMEVSVRSTVAEVSEITSYTYSVKGNIESVQTNTLEMMDFDGDGVLKPTVMSTITSYYTVDARGIVQRMEINTMYDEPPTVFSFKYSYY